VVRGANALAESPPSHLSVERRAQIESLAEVGDAISVTLVGGRACEVDALVSLTGYRPDQAPLGELALETAPSTEGAARLSRALAGVTDCLSVPEIGARDLESGEPGFALVGHKSYGRSSAFLLKSGLDQLERVVGLL
jgi:hypothetical protein